MTARILVVDPDGAARRKLPVRADVELLGTELDQPLGGGDRAVVADAESQGAALEFCLDLQEASPAVRCVVLSSLPEDAPQLRAIVAGLVDSLFPGAVRHPPHATHLPPDDAPRPG